MPYISNIHIVFFVQFFFKGQDAKYSVNTVSDFANPRSSPCPYLWGDKIDNRHSMFFCKLSNFQVKTWKVYDNQESWFFLDQVALHNVIRFPDIFQFSEDFADACNRNVAVIIDDTHSDFLKSCTAHTAELEGH